MWTQAPIQRIPILAWFSLSLTTVGVVLGMIVCIHILDDWLQNQVAQRANYLLIATTPVFDLLAPTETPTPAPTQTVIPSATPSPTPTSTPTSTPAPPVRIRIPYIAVNSSIVEIQPEIYKIDEEKIEARWPVPGYAVGYYFNSGRPGTKDNIVLTGHNNWLGEVFRDLYLLKINNEIILYTSQAEYRYIIHEIVIVPYRRNPAKGEEIVQSYSGSTSDEQVTLISCYPYLSNSDRIVIIAHRATD